MQGFSRRRDERHADDAPDTKVRVRELLGLDSDLEVPAFSESLEHVPEVDEGYRFDPQTMWALLAGFAHNRRVLIQGYHGTGKSTLSEQDRRAGKRSASRLLSAACWRDALRFPALLGLLQNHGQARKIPQRDFSRS